MDIKMFVYENECRYDINLMFLENIFQNFSSLEDCIICRNKGIVCYFVQRDVVKFIRDEFVIFV